MPPTTTYASPSTVHFNVIGPSTVYELHPDLNKNSYETKEFQASFFISSTKIILKQLAKYSSVFPDTTSKGSPYPFPEITLHYPGNVASESGIDYDPVQDLMDTLQGPTRIILFMWTHWVNIKSGLRQKNFGQFCEAFESVNKIMIWAPRLRSKALFEVVFQASYGRSIKPQLQRLVARGKKKEEETYGELLSPMLEFIFAGTRLAKHSTFVDLGSGIGNTLVEAAFKIGCFAYGIEIRKEVADLGQLFIQEFKMRSSFVGVTPGEIEFENGDMCASARAVEVLKQADVVLVNNKLFGGELTEKLKTLLLNMRVGSVVICTQSLTLCGTTRSGACRGRGGDDFIDKFRSETMRYEENWVSWTGSAGEYFWLTKLKSNEQGPLKDRTTDVDTHK
ncbi:histone methylation protein DOT1-domain-containing protein [Lentinula raphanica]|nr:histone methylation protein DOT1-domain-containing protein [Lentinula raphanica]